MSVSRVRCIANREQHSNTVVMMSILTSHYCAYGEKAASNFNAEVTPLKRSSFILWKFFLGRAIL